MIAAFLTWWLHQLASLMPGRDQAGRRDAVLVSLRGDSVDVALRRRGRQGALGTFALTAAGMSALGRAMGQQRGGAELRLPPGAVLEQQVALPLAAERDPQRVLQYEMDRLTPFKAEELHWAWRVERRDPARSQLLLRLTLVLRSAVDDAVAMLGSGGVQVAALVGAEGQAVPLGSVRAGPWQRRARLALLAGSAVLAVATVVVPFVRQSQEARRIEREIAALRPAVEQAEALRRTQSQTAAGIDVLAAQRMRFGEPLAILAALTDILPDDTVLTDLTLRQRVITIAGQSAAAARLIPALAADPMIRSPAFTAPVTRNDTTKTDLFSVRAEAASPADTARAAIPGRGP